MRVTVREKSVIQTMAHEQQTLNLIEKFLRQNFQLLTAQTLHIVRDLIKFVATLFAWLSHCMIYIYIYCFVATIYLHISESQHWALLFLFICNKQKMCSSPWNNHDFFTRSKQVKQQNKKHETNF